MTRASQHIAEAIVTTLQERVAGWQAERMKLESRITRQERVQERYTLLGELIAEAEAEITAVAARAERAQPNRDPR